MWLVTLKGPKHENFGSELLNTIWVDNLGTRRKKLFCRLGRSHSQHSLSDLNRILSMRLKYSITNIWPKHKKIILLPRILSHLPKQAFIV
jgi:hypothetical protein